MGPEITTRIENDLKRIKTLIPTGESIKSYLSEVIEEQLASVSSKTSMGVVPSSMLSSSQMYGSALMAAELIEDPKQLAARPEISVDLGVIEWMLRPSLPLKSGLFVPLKSGPWKNLRADLVKDIESSVGRIELHRDGYLPIHLGTGFVVDGNLQKRLIIMTNAHVIDEAIRQGWSKIDDLSLVYNFKHYSQTLDSKCFTFSSDYQIHAKYDLALVYLDKEIFEHTVVKPIGLSISEKAPETLINLNIGVIGHPSFNSSRDPFPKYFGFGNEFGIKRFSPGYIRSLENRDWRKQDVNVFLHDASTLSGSSGSCILDLDTHQVIGLHFGGWPMQKQVIETGGQEMIAELFHANGAVPLWTLKNDPLLKEVHFE